MTKRKSYSIGLGIIIQYDYFANYIDGFVKALIFPTTGVRYTSDQEAEKIKEEILCVDNLTSDRSDLYHIRNAFAHAHFIFDGSAIDLWDRYRNTETFRNKYSLEDMKRLINRFIEKLVVLQSVVFFLQVGSILSDLEKRYYGI